MHWLVMDLLGGPNLLRHYGDGFVLKGIKFDSGEIGFKPINLSVFAPSSTAKHLVESFQHSAAV